MYAKRLWVASLTARLSAFHSQIGDVIDVENLISDTLKFRVLSIAHNPLSGIGWINIECVEARDLSGDTITTLLTTRTSGKESGQGGNSLGGFIGGGVGGEQVWFRGLVNKAIRGIVYYDQYGQPIYDWRTTDDKNRITKESSMTQP
jgi:hypothetical protein